MSDAPRRFHPFARKPIDVLIQEMNAGSRLHRVLGPWALTALGVGATVGAGIYVLTGEIAHNIAGPSLMLSMLLAAVGCGLAALCYSEMASMVPVAGSCYTYAYATMGEMVAWIIGWDLILEYAIGSSVVAVGWGNYMVSALDSIFGVAIDPRWTSSPWVFTPEHGFHFKLVTLANGLQSQAFCNLPAALICLLITVILVIGIKESARFNAAMVILNLAIIGFIICVGAFYIRPSNWVPFYHPKHGYGGVTEGAAKIFFAYIGFDSISTHSEEAKNPSKDLAFGIIASLIICTVLYMGATAVLTGMVPSSMIDPDAPMASAFRDRGLPFAGSFISVGIILGITSALLVGMLSQPRILLAMARDGMLPHRIFAEVHPKYQTPWKSTILVGFVVAGAGALAPLGFLAELVSVGTLFAFVVVCASVMILRWRSPEVHRPFRVPFLPLVAGFGILFNGGLMFSLGRDNWIRLIVWLGLGMLVYFGYSRHHTREPINA